MLLNSLIQPTSYQTFKQSIRELSRSEPSPELGQCYACRWFGGLCYQVTNAHDIGHGRIASLKVSFVLQHISASIKNTIYNGLSTLVKGMQHALNNLNHIWAGMTPTRQALLPGRCSRITGQVVQQAVEVMRLGPLNRTARYPCEQGFLTLAKCT